MTQASSNPLTAAGAVTGGAAAAVPSVAHPAVGSGAGALSIRSASIDVGSALVSSFAVAPFITLIDRSIFQNASGQLSMGASVRAGAKELLTAPWRAVARPEFGYVFAVYGSTYVVANNVESYCKRNGINADLPKFTAVSATNMLMSVWKDKAFTRLFAQQAATATVAAPKALPIASYLLFFTRDSMTIAASFNAPQRIADYLVAERGWDRQPARVTAQLLAPVAVQFFSAPLHLLALDLYNRPGASSGARFSFLRREYLKTALARCSRIFPAFGICGVGNALIKEWLNKDAQAH